MPNPPEELLNKNLSLSKVNKNSCSFYHSLLLHHPSKQMNGLKRIEKLYSQSSISLSLSLITLIKSFKEHI